MKGMVIVILALALLAGGFVIGYFARPILRPQGPGAEGSETATPAEATSSPPPPPAAGAGSPAPEEPRYQFTRESLPMKRVLGVDDLWRYQGGPPQIHVQYFVDYVEGGVVKRGMVKPPAGSPGKGLDPPPAMRHVEGGVKKRAFLQAFNIGPARGAGAFPQWYCDVAQSEGVITWDKSALRSLHQFSVNFQRSRRSSRGRPRPLYSTWDPLDWDQQLSKEPKETLVLDFDKVQTDPPRFPCFPYWRSSFSGTVLSSVSHGTRQFESLGHVYFVLHQEQDRELTYAGHPGKAVLVVVVVGDTQKAPATVEACDVEVARLRKELAASSEDARLKWKLAWAVEYQRAFRKQQMSSRSYGHPGGYPTDEKLRLAPTDYPADETVRLVREVSSQVPGNMFYRAELRRLLFRHAWLNPDGIDVMNFPELFQEILSLVPLDNSEHLEAAKLLSCWKNTVLRKGSPEDKKKQLFQEADAKVVQLLRLRAEVWQNHPEEIQKKLRAYEEDATGQSYAETPQFKELLDQMREWAKKG